ncbi:ABC transporter ATP-binding protein [Roseateles sp.]|uniref:ABC transporter ATP-binding protein n=1 Tax=Roseateles sp. TaxID=1971397 RepID=UPI0039EC5EAD
MSVALRLEGVRLGYELGHEFHTVVDDASLTLDAGRIGCLLGPSGGGKSTLLRAIAGFEPVRAGRILIGDRVVASANVSVAPERRSVGLMFQEYALFPHLTAAQNVGFGLRKWSRAERDARVLELLELVGLAAAGGRYPHELSGGQQQRIALVRALAPRPALLLLDEPFSNLDAQTRERLVVEVRDILRAAGQTALLVTHNEAEAAALADQVSTVGHGRLENRAA